MSTYLERCRRLIAIDFEQREIAKRVKDLETERALLEEQLLEDFIEAGRQRDTPDGRTIYLRTDTYASAVRPEGEPWDGVIDQLEQAGWGDVVVTAPNSQKVRSRVIELKKEGAEVPEALRDVINITTRSRILVSASKED